MLKNIFALLLVILLLSNCNKDDENIPLPDTVSIQILNYDIDDSSVLIKGSEVSNGLEGKWILIDGDFGSFTDINESLTTFKGALFEDYKIKWSITNGTEEISTEKSFNIGGNFNLIQLVNQGVEIAELLNEFTIQQLTNAGVTINQLIDAGVTVQELIDAGLPLNDIVNSGISSLQLIELGVSKDDLVASNIIVQIPGTTLYILNYFYEKFDYSSAITFCDNLTIGDLNNWYLPTLNDLRTIYNIRDQVLLEYTDEDYWSSTFSHNGTDENGTNANYLTKNMKDGFESTFYGFEKRIIPVIQL